MTDTRERANGGPEGDLGATNKTMGSTNNDRSASEQPGAGGHRGRRLLSAIERGDVATIRDGDLLKDLCSTVDDRRATSGWTPLMLAAAMGDDEVTQLLLEAGGDVGHALPIACALGHLDVARHLIAGGAELTLEDPGGMNALSLASQAGQDDLVEELLRAGLPVDAPESSTGMTALGRAALAGHATTVAALLSNGASVDLEDRQGSTPLHYAASSANRLTCRALLVGGADPNHRCGEGRSTLVAAISARAYFRLEDGSFEVRPYDEAELLPVVDLLLRWGAEVEPEGRELGRARELGYTSIVKSLSEFGVEALREAG
ncbi:MAG: ankyrin repeat domain-containing protein [Planctomycetes bacterium]|nr:ankyrin repeat domain-containing protein [Planctomycetota bacterium]